MVAWRPGRFDLEAQAPGYVPQRRQVILVRGRANAAVVQVDLPSSSGYLQIESLPTGAAVEVIDPMGPVTARGATPYLSPRLPAGRYTVRLSKELHRSKEVSATVPDRERVARVPTVTLEAAHVGLTAYDRLVWVYERLHRPIAAPWRFEKTPLGRVAETISNSEGIEVLRLPPGTPKSARSFTDTSITFSLPRGSWAAPSNGCLGSKGSHGCRPRPGIN